MKDLRYLKSKKKFLEFSHLALGEQFSSMEEFTSFFNSIEGDEKKNQFLETASFYLFLVKQGDWLVDISGSDSKIDYLTETYKYIGLFSLIESLHKNNFIDFYSYLERGKSKVEFPIKNKDELEFYYRKYKEEFGAIQQSVSFFKAVSMEKQNSLIKKIEVKGTEPTIENWSKYLYELRSKFVHEAKLVLNMSHATTVGKRGSKTVICKMSIKDLMAFFEKGLVSLFEAKKDVN